jgi:hypothetical protein
MAEKKTTKAPPRKRQPAILNRNTQWLLEELERSERGLPPRKRPEEKTARKR